MRLWIVRHGRAVRRRTWEGPADRRPLDAMGRRQADALAAMLALDPPEAIMTSPAVRCRETVVPLHHASSVPIRLERTLQPPTKPAAVVELLGRLADRTLLCTHGEVMTPLLAALRAAGVEVADDLRDVELLQSGATWELDLTALSLVCRSPLALARAQG
ncbi:MAG: phosphoglycerate mutase family protein [Acidimicrobiales bacterium]